MILSTFIAMVTAIWHRITKIFLVGTLLVSLFSCGSASTVQTSEQEAFFVADPVINLLKVKDKYYYYVGTLATDKDIKEDIITSFKSLTSTYTVYSTSNALYPGIVVVNQKEVLDDADYVYVEKGGMDVSVDLISEYPPTDDELYEGKVIEYDEKKYYEYCSTPTNFSDVGQEMFKIDDITYYQVKNRSGWICTPNDDKTYDLYFTDTIKKLPIDFIAYTAYGLEN